VSVRLNPFPRGSVRPERYLYGRSGQLEAIERFTHGVQNRQSSDIICFLAPAGLGKTSLLKLARRQLQRKGWFCGYSEASSDATTSILDLLSDASDALPSEGIGAKFRARLEEFHISAGPVGLGLKLGPGAPSDMTAYSQLSRLLANLGQLAVQAQVGVALIIDEAQALPRPDLELLMRVINRLDDLPIAVLIGGLPNIPRKLVDGDDDYARTGPDIWYYPLHPLTVEESRCALETPVIDAGCRLQPEALELLVSFAEGNPLVLQMLGSAAWLEADRSAAANEIPSIISDYAQRAIDSVRSQLAISVYEPIWMGCTDVERATLRAVALAGQNADAPGSPSLTWHPASMFSEAVIPGVNRHELVPDILHRFAGNGIIYPQESMFQVEIRFVTPGFGDYLTQRSGGTASGEDR
jgi:hypothetical protein